MLAAESWLDFTSTFWQQSLVVDAVDAEIAISTISGKVMLEILIFPLCKDNVVHN